MAEATSLRGHFLIAMPSFSDPNFAQTVTLICEHTPAGAMGIVVNQPLELNLGEVFRNMAIICDDPAINEQPVYLGGPVQKERGFVLHRPTGNWEASAEVTNNLCITTSREILVSMSRGEVPGPQFVALGYAGWGPSQLEKEIMDNAWLCGPADEKILFETPWHERWQAAAKLLGIDLTLLSTDIGHA